MHKTDHSPFRDPRTVRAGITLLEVLMAIGVVALILAITIPAVLSSRETSRNIRCRSRVGELILACHSFEEAHGYVPTRKNHPYRKLLPYLGASHLKDALETRPRPPGLSFGDSVFCCPSDPMLLVERGHYSYHMNDGTAFRLYGGNGFMVYITSPRERKLADITDGLSQTAAFSERLDDGLVGVRELESLMTPFQRVLGFTPRVINTPGHESDFANLCRAERLPPKHGTQAIMVNADLGGPGGGGYDHLLPPNSAGCANGPETGYDSWNPLVPATSLHPGGVNVAYADGHCTFVSELIDTNVWRAVGTAFGNRPAF